MIVTAQQPIVLIIDDDASVRDGFEDLLRSVGLGAQSFRSTGEFRAVGPICPVALCSTSDCLGRVDWNFSVHWRKRGSTQSYSSASWLQSHVGEGNAIGRAIEFLTKPVRSRSCLMR